MLPGVNKVVRPRFGLMGMEWRVGHIHFISVGILPVNETEECLRRMEWLFGDLTGLRAHRSPLVTIFSKHDEGCSTI